jgi:hypothetical protein
MNSIDPNFLPVSTQLCRTTGFEPRLSMILPMSWGGVASARDFLSDKLWDSPRQKSVFIRCHSHGLTARPGLASKDEFAFLSCRHNHSMSKNLLSDYWWFAVSGQIQMLHSAARLKVIRDLKQEKQCTCPYLSGGHRYVGEPFSEGSVKTIVIFIILSTTGT